jgi:hypothetical protein
VKWLMLLAVVAAAAETLWLPSSAQASPYARYGMQDDAWLLYGPGSVADRVATLDRMGVTLVRFTLNWRDVAPRQPVNARAHTDLAYRWGATDEVLQALHARGMNPVVTLWGTPRWANGGRSANWAPISKWSLAAFAYAAQKRYPFVSHWLVWNEPNQRRWLRPTSARVYTQRLLNPTYGALKAAKRTTKVGGGVTAPRGAYGGVSPVDFIRGMRAARARIDAYAHHPYPLRRGETPWRGGCGHCETITMATLERLLRNVKAAFGGGKRIWLTEYGYQTNPPDRLLGVSRAQQARFVGEAAHRAFKADNVDMLIHYLYRDEPGIARWQSGFITAGGSAKPSRRAYMVAMAQAYRRGRTTAIWAHVRPGTGRQVYVLQQLRNGGWRTVNGAYRTTKRGFLYRYVRAGRGSKLPSCTRRRARSARSWWCGSTCARRHRSSADRYGCSMGRLHCSWRWPSASALPGGRGSCSPPCSQRFRSWPGSPFAVANSASRVELLEDFGPVALDGLGADHEQVRDLLRRVGLRDELEDLAAPFIRAPLASACRAGL